MSRLGAAAPRLLALASLLLLLSAGGCGEPHSAGTDFEITKVSGSVAMRATPN